MSRDDGFRNYVTDLADRAIDLITKSEALKEVPIAKTLVQLWEGFQSVRDEVLLRKLTQILDAMSEVSAEKRACSRGSSAAF